MALGVALGADIAVLRQIFQHGGYGHAAVVLGDAPETGAHDGMIVDDKNTNHWARARSGIRSATVVPPVVPLEIVTVPPNVMARSRRPSKPSECDPRIAAGVMPRPSSLTMSERMPDSILKDTRMHVALACFATLFSASCSMRKTAEAISSRGDPQSQSMSSSSARPVRAAKSCACHSMASGSPS